MTAVHHPAPKNQFYQLTYDEVHKVWVKAKPWNHLHPVGGRLVDYDSTMCMSAAGAVALDAQTRQNVSPGAIHDHQDDMTGGIGVTDVRTAFQRGWGQAFWCPTDFNWDDVMHAVSVQRRHAILGVDYRKVPYLYQVQKGGNFDHAINVDDWRSTDGRISRYDSLDTKAVWTPQSAYRYAAEALALRVRGNKGQLFVGLTNPRPLLVTPPTYKVVIHPQKGTKGYPARRWFGLYTVLNGRVVHVEEEHTGGMSATADNRAFYPYPGHTRQELVRLTSGQYKDQYVRVGYVVAA